MKTSAMKALSGRDFMAMNNRRKHLPWTARRFGAIVPAQREASMTFKDILYATEGAVATITLNRPGYRNALSYRLLDEIDGAFTQAGKDKAVRVVVIRGSGGNFSSGHDLGTPGALEYRKPLGAAPRTI